MKQRLSVDLPVTLIIQAVHGDLAIRGWAEPLIEWQSDDRQVTVTAQADGLVVSPCAGDLQLAVPETTDVRIVVIHGDARAQNLYRLTAERVEGDLSLRQITGQATIGSLEGDLTATTVAELSVTADVHGDVSLTEVPVVHLAGVAGDVNGRGVLSLTINQVDGDLEVAGLSEQLRVANVNGDVELTVTGTADVQLDRVNGDLTLKGQARRMQCLTVSSDVDASEAQIDQFTIETVAGDVEAGTITSGRMVTIGGDLELSRVSGDLTVSHVGGDCVVKQAAGNVMITAIGGDLRLHAAATAGSTIRAQVGSDAVIVLPETPDLTINAVVGGEVSGIETRPSIPGQMLELRYGQGNASIHLHVGGDLTIKGAGQIDSFSSIGAQLGQELSELGRELGRELSELGRELAAELRSALAGNDPRAGERARAAAERFAEQARRWKAESGPERMRVKINQREWRLDPERIERIKEQARQAAAAGLNGALEAVERALSRIQSPPPPPPAAPNPPPPPHPPAAPPPPHPPATGPTVQLRPVPSQSPMSEAEREHQRASILQMVADGRISAAEGDLLLAALDEDRG
ncbi:DUF4097 family beta strand repeat-containing protein [Chloroflexus sp.]|uniref:DUF4097 family beta strand repeat-containing protein n=1 Tax=Chloroflexus sp. TaxID=1904827 RepID=UPI002ADD390B|nr:DUF4097 family beta strand repeat-containing protein [Chloroflexus sp.]